MSDRSHAMAPGVPAGARMSVHVFLGSLSREVEAWALPTQLSRDSGTGPHGSMTAFQR